MAFKRFFDVVAATTGLLVLSPILLLVAALVWVFDGWPVLYRSQRIGRFGRPFIMLKFRTMCHNADSMGPTAVQAGDFRVTKLGVWLRRIKVDEFPQLVNIIRGEMSVTGPRPETLRYMDTFSGEYAAVLKVRPGLSGWASLWDFDEAAMLSGAADPEKAYRAYILPTKRRLQLEYIRNWSFRLDLKIIFYTLVKLVFRQWLPREMAALLKTVQVLATPPFAGQGNAIPADGNTGTLANQVITPRILLSIPHMGVRERFFVEEAFRTNWLSTTGPNIFAFEDEFAAVTGRPAVALSSGTAALHLAVRLLGIKPGDDVFCSTLTFVATANPVTYQGGALAFIDCDASTWNIDPQILKDALSARARQNRLPKALVAVHLYGQCCDMDPILECCDRYEIPVVEDAAEALGATYKGRLAGTLTDLSAFSFNGNKIITTTGGGMLSSPREEWIEKARFWSAQARNPGLAYEHSETGYNYRMSNVLAGIGRGQLTVLSQRVEQRRAIFSRYSQGLADIDGLAPMPQAPYGCPTNWLSCFLIDEVKLGCSRNEVIRGLDGDNVESRPVWKPMHLQPLFGRCERFGGEVAERLFRNGICLPSSSSLSIEEQLHVVNSIRKMAGAASLSEFPRREAAATA